VSETARHNSRGSHAAADREQDQVGGILVMDPRDWLRFFIAQPANADIRIEQIRHK
jgi:hypothetical protein